MKIAYLVGEQGRPSEQFIAREISAVEALGAEVVAYSVERERGFVCPWCVLGRHAWLSLLPGTWRAAARFPFGRLALCDVRAWREFVGGLDLAAVCARDMRAKGIEHVHAHFGTKPAAVGMMIAAMLRLPLTISMHARDVFADGVALKQKVAAAARVAVCSGAALDALKAKIPGALHGRLVLIRHGLELSQFAFSAERPSLPVTAGTTVHGPGSSSVPSSTAEREPRSPSGLSGTAQGSVLAAGRLVEKKGFRHLIEAMERLADCSCKIAGDGPLRAELEREIERRGLAGRVRLVGWLSPEELRARMAEADVLAAPSIVARDGDRDGVPNVLLEAAALGLPIVASDAGGIGEFIIDGETGHLTPPGDTAALAGAVRAALSDVETTRRLAQNARKKVENEYDLRENVKLLMDLFTRPGQGRT